MASLTVAVRTKTVLALALICSPLTLADAPVRDEPTTAEVKTLLRLNGSEDIASNLGRLIGEGVIAEMHRANPNLPERADAIVSTTVEQFIREQSSYGTVVDLLVPIYAKYLSRDEVESLIAFYRSPVGRKLASVTPAISFDSTRAGQHWAESIGASLQLKLQEALRREKVIQ